jgi:alkylation response protein AidB-like acyl-CoA dehydrogenase
MRKHPNAQALLNQVETLLPLIRADALTAERQGHLTNAVLAALFEQRFFRLFIPERYQGEATDLPTALKVFERIAYADGATGWLVMIGAGGGLFSGFMAEAAARKIFEPENAVIAGSGMPSGLAKTTKDGFEASGRWAYASGAHHATWFTANCKVDDTEDILAIAVPAAEVTVHSTWSAFGMKATGSHDFSVEKVSMPRDFTFSLADAPVLNDPIFHCPLETLASVTFGSVAIGIAQHALEAFQAFAQHKTVYGQDGVLAEQPAIQQCIEQAQTQIESARTQLYALADAVWQACEHGQAPDEALRTQVQTECVTLVQNCLRAADSLKARAGMMAVFDTSEFGQAWRDLHVLSQHAILSPPLD